MPKTGANIYRRKDGRYEGRILTGKTVYQKPHYIYVYGKTLREVKAKMEKSKVEWQESQKREQVKMQLAARGWLQKMRGQWKPTTYDVYRRAVRLYVEPILGNYDVSAVDKSVLEAFSKEMVKRSESGTLSPKYQKYVCAIVCQIIAYASDAFGLEPETPLMPDFHIQKKEVELPDEKDLAVLESYLLKHLEEDTCLGILFAKYTGIRIGELCALQWKDIDLDNGIVVIKRNLQRIKNYSEVSGGKTKICLQKPKTMKSVRMIPLADSLVERLREHEKEPEKYLISGRKCEWAEIRTVQYRFASILKKCGIASFHFHLLRHAFASRCISAGCDMKSLSEVLGHSNVQITMSIYVHSSLQQKKELMNHVCRLPQED